MQTWITQMIAIAGAGQIALAIGSVAIPKLLAWQQEIAKVRPLIKQIFWTYAVYILCTNLSFGLISFFDSRELVSGSGLAKAITGFITVYWISRILIQFFYFDRTDFPKGGWYAFGETALVSLFFFLSMTYALAFCFNCRFI